MGVAKWMGGLLALGTLGACLGLLDEPVGPPTVNTPSSSTSIAEPIVLSSTSVAGTVPTTVTLLTAPPVSGESGDDSDRSVDEIDCEQAEELADWGEYEAGDIADYCDYGPDPGELPDEFDWDE